MITETQKEAFQYIKNKFRKCPKSLHEVIDCSYDHLEEATSKNILEALDKFQSENFGYFLCADGRVRRK